MSGFNKHLIIVGSARSGTSWLCEVIARRSRYRLLFEPEHEFNTPKGFLIADKWIRNHVDSLDAHQYLKKVFANRVDNDWIAQNSNRKYKMHLWPLIPKRYIIKFVRANLSAKYLNECFGIPLIHIIRNPYDVLASQRRVNFPWLYSLDHFKKQDALVALLNKEFNFDLRQVEGFTPLEILTVRWCLENVLPLRVFEPYQSKHIIVKYEDLRNDINVYLEICKEFNLEPIENLQKEYKRPSSKTHPRSKIIDVSMKDESFNEEEVNQINRILNVFRCNLYPIKKYRTT